MSEINTSELQTPNLELPAGWRWARLGEVCIFEYGTGLTDRDRFGGEVPVFGSNGIVGYHNVAITQGPTIIIGRKGSIGQANYSESPCWPIDTTYYIDSSKTNCDIIWLYWLLKSLRLDLLNKATGVPGLNRGDAYKQLIPLPPLPEQKRIAAKIQELMQEVERARTACEKQLEAAEALPFAYLREVFESDEAKEWEKKKLGEVCKINPSRPKNFYRSADAPTTFVPMAAIDEKTGTIAKPEIVPYSKVSKGYTYFEERDVLFAKITPCMQNGKHVIARNLIDGIGFGTTEFHVLRPDSVILPEWIHFFIRQPYFLQEATAYFTGAVGQQRVPDSFLSNYIILLPPIEEQKNIVADLKEKMAHVENLQFTIYNQQLALDALPQAILRKAFKGEL